MYEVRKAALMTLEQASQQGYIDLLYGDETQVAQTGFVPYGWQFDDEQVAIEVQKGKAINCSGLLARSNQFHYWLNRSNINAQFVIDILDEFSWHITKVTDIVLDNARIHTA